VQEEAHLKVMRMIDANPQISQREIAAELGISLGKTNYCLRALTEKGFVKARNFRRSANKMRYLYRLTPKGVEHKARLTLAFLERKRREYEALRREIDELSREADGGSKGP
jgi:EPS-associated MarR family transcriptional regulator